MHSHRVTTQTDHLAKKASNFGLVKSAVKAEMNKMRGLNKALGEEIIKRAPAAAKDDAQKTEDSLAKEFARAVAALDGVAAPAGAPAS